MSWGVLGSVLMVASGGVVDSAQGAVYVLGAVHGAAPTDNKRLTNVFQSG